MNISRKKIILILVILLSFSIGIFYYFYGSVKKNNVSNLTDSEFLSSLLDIKNKAISEEENNAYIAFRAVEMQNNVESCKILRKKDQNQCFLSIANTNNDRKICDFIDDEIVKNICFENFTYKEIIVSGDIKNCATLSSSTKDLCMYEYFRTYKKVDECSVLESADKQKCLNTVNGSQAYELNDNSLCDQMSDDSLKNNCKDVVKNKPIDSDKDGLNDSDERSFGTNPFGLDTDGDGLSDYDEIFVFHTSPIKKDTKENGYGDGVQKFVK